MFSWHAKLITLDRRKTLVFVNDRNRYVIVLYGLKAKDFKKLDVLILEAIAATLREECVDEDVITKYLDHSKEVRFSKTKDRSTVAKLNKACDNAYFYSDLLDKDSIPQSIMSTSLSKGLSSNGKREYIMDWGKSQDYREFDMKAINHLLSSIY